LLDFPNFCGAGKKDSFGERVIPDRGLGMYFMHCCFIHDVTHALFPATYFYFCISNVILFFNMFMTIIQKKQKMKLLRVMRIHRAANYLIGVQTEIGWQCFINGKENRNEDEYKWYEDEHILETFSTAGVDINNLKQKV